MPSPETTPVRNPVTPDLGEPVPATPIRIPAVASEVRSTSGVRPVPAVPSWDCTHVARGPAPGVLLPVAPLWVPLTNEVPLREPAATEERRVVLFLNAELTVD